jgi:hypothetical protein
LEHVNHVSAGRLGVATAQLFPQVVVTGALGAQQGPGVTQFVILYRSLGGGWEPYQLVPPIPQPMPAIIAAFKRLLAPDVAP